MDYKFRKKYFYRSLFVSLVTTIVSFLICYNINHYYYSRLGIPAIIAISLIPVNIFVYKATKTPLHIDDVGFSFVSTVNGSLEIVDFSQIRILKYIGREKLISDDQLILELIDGRTLRIFWGYENHYELWEKIIIGAINHSMCLNISPSVIKKMDERWTDSDCENKAVEISKHFDKSYEMPKSIDFISAKRVFKLLIIIVGIIAGLIVILALISFIKYLITGEV
ncbi:MAG: hypothetical protein IJK26_01995 [Clostridia bacterium]|nr:hypothetical protein [Clostridia bacterium]